MTTEALDEQAMYHLATSAQWSDYRAGGAIVPSTLDVEGFVHCSWGRQVAGTVAKHFPGATDLLALEIDAQRLDGVVVVEEDLYRSGQPFPHVYGPIPADAVRSVTRLA